jgi:hypothetical protein
MKHCWLARFIYIMDFVCERVLVESYVLRGVEKRRNWNPVLIRIVLLIYTPYSLLFHSDALKDFLHL